MEAAPDMDCLLDELEEEVIATEALKENRKPMYNDEVVKFPIVQSRLSSIPKPEQEVTTEHKTSIYDNLIMPVAQPNEPQINVYQQAEELVAIDDKDKSTEQPQNQFQKLSPKHSLDTIVPIEEKPVNSWLHEDTHSQITNNSDITQNVSREEQEVGQEEEANETSLEEDSEYDDVLKYLDECEGETMTAVEIHEEGTDVASSNEKLHSVSLELADSLVQAAEIVADRVLDFVGCNVEAELKRTVLESLTDESKNFDTKLSSEPIISTEDNQMEQEVNFFKVDVEHSELDHNSISKYNLTSTSESQPIDLNADSLKLDDNGEFNFENSTEQGSFSSNAQLHDNHKDDFTRDTEQKDVQCLVSDEEVMEIATTVNETEDHFCRSSEDDKNSLEIRSPENVEYGRRNLNDETFETNEESAIDIVQSDKELEDDHLCTCSGDETNVFQENSSDTVQKSQQPDDVEYDEGSLHETNSEEFSAIDVVQSDAELEDEGNTFENEPMDELTTVHVLPSDEMESEEGGHRLTECELMVGKVKPHWIPDSDCTCCMLCSLKFSLLLRRHHCRACGRLLCAACCSEKELLPYMIEAGKKAVAERVCMPCAVTLRRITEHESRRDSVEHEYMEETNRRSVLKNNRNHDESTTDAEPAPSQEELVDRKRSVRFRDGVQPGSSTGGHTEAEKSTAIKPKKKSRKRSSVVRRITELRIEDELTSALPASSDGPYFVIKPDDTLDSVDSEYCLMRLSDGCAVSIILKKNLHCVIRLEKVGNSEHWCVSSRGFEYIGLDELVFVWIKEENETVAVPFNILEKISEIFCSSFETEKSGVRPVAQRMPSLFSQPEAKYPLTRHIYFFKPTCQKLPYCSLPSSSYLVACFVLDEELPWITAMPNRVLLSIGLKYGAYPTPIVNHPKRKPVVEMDPNNSIMKVFTDFRKWRYRISHVYGSTVSLSIDRSVIKIPRIASNEIKSIIDCNRSMIAWSCDINSLADSHLCCREDDGLCQTHILSRESTTALTGASFVVIDAGLKTSESGEAVVNMIEDGICIRMHSSAFQSLIDNLTADVARDFSLKTHSTELIIKWIDEFENITDFVVRSDIDGMVLESKYQYGLSLERAISSSLVFASVPDSAVRLSHVYNLKEGRLAPAEEPKVFGVAELIARECTAYLDPYFQMLLSMNIRSMSIRIDASPESVEYILSTWVGLEDEQAKFRQSMDDLIPILYNIMAYFPNGINIEMKLSFVSTKSLPIGN